MKRKKSFEFHLATIVAMYVFILIALLGFSLNSFGYMKITSHYYNEQIKDVSIMSSNIVSDVLREYDNLSGDRISDYGEVKDIINKVRNTMGLNRIVVFIPDNDYSSSKVLYDSANDYTLEKDFGDSLEQDINDQYKDSIKEIMDENIDDKFLYDVKDIFNTDKYVNSFFSYKDLDGNTKAIILIVKEKTELEKYRKISWNVFLSASFILLIISYICTYYFIKIHIDKPFDKLAKEAERFAQENTKLSDNFSSFYTGRLHEVNSMADSIKKMEDDVLNYIDKIKLTTKKNERMNNELQFASAIQKADLWTKFPAFPDRTDFDIYASMDPAREVGGDFYDFFLIDDNHMALVIADVAGKGVPAALMMMTTKIYINEYLLDTKNPAKALEKLNNKYANDNKNDMFVALWAGIIELDSGKLIYSNAGHEDPVIIREKTFEIKKTKHGLPLGAIEDFKYDNNTIILNKSDKLLLFTDGVIDAVNNDNIKYGKPNLMKVLDSNVDSSPKEVIFDIKKNITKFVEKAKQFDDITMLCFELKNPKDIHMQGRFKADLSEISNVFKYFTTKMITELDEERLAKYYIVVEEIFTNITNYAFDNNSKNNYVNIDVYIDKKSKKVTITFRDSGKKFNPLEHDEPDINLKAKDREIGGLGILIVKKMMDNVSYEYKNKKNILTIEKYYK